MKSLLSLFLVQTFLNAVFFNSTGAPKCEKAPNHIGADSTLDEFELQFKPSLKSVPGQKDTFLADANKAYRVSIKNKRSGPSPKGFYVDLLKGGGELKSLTCGQDIEDCPFARVTHKDASRCTPYMIWKAPAAGTKATFEFVAVKKYTEWQKKKQVIVEVN